jgi:hypothetical protein
MYDNAAIELTLHCVHVGLGMRWSCLHHFADVVLFLVLPCYG